MAIPGQKDMALQRFEDSFFEELAMQHDRVNLFVTSKASEISYRLSTTLGGLTPQKFFLENEQELTDGPHPM